jgi:hypothetical protein
VTSYYISFRAKKLIAAGSNMWTDNSYEAIATETRQPSIDYTGC